MKPALLSPPCWRTGRRGSTFRARSGRAVADAGATIPAPTEPDPERGEFTARTPIGARLLRPRALLHPRGGGGGGAPKHLRRRRRRKRREHHLFLNAAAVGGGEVYFNPSCCKAMASATPTASPGCPAARREVELPYPHYTTARVRRQTRRLRRRAGNARQRPDATGGRPTSRAHLQSGNSP